MVVPVGDETGKEIGAPKKRAVGHRPPAENKMIAAAGAGVPAIELELLRPEPTDARRPVDRLPDPDELLPAARRRHIDLDHPRIGRHLEPRQTVIPRRGIALEHHRAAVRCGDCLDAGEEIEPVVDRLTQSRQPRVLQRRQEEMEPPGTDLSHKRRPHDRRPRPDPRLVCPGKEPHWEPQPRR